jgi:hypothetical protein
MRLVCTYIHIYACKPKPSLSTFINHYIHRVNNSTMSLMTQATKDPATLYESL